MVRSSKRRSSRRSSGRTTTRRIVVTAKSRPISTTAYWIAGLSTVALAAAGTALYFTSKKSATPSSPVTPPPPGVLPSGLPTTGDVYASLSAAQQSAVQGALYAYIVQGYGSCTGVFPNGMSDITSNGITGPASLADSGNRSLAVDCYQQAHNLPVSNGTLDLSTYRLLMGV